MNRSDVDARYKTAAKIASGFWFVKRNIKVPKALTAAYVFYRIFRPVLKTYYWIFKRFNRMTPWTSPASIVIFRQLLTKSMAGIEFGSGRSTAFFAHHLGRLVSIEHHAGWYEKVEEWLRERQLSNVDYRLRERDGAAGKEFPGEITAFFPGGFVPQSGYVAYVSELLTFQDESVDFLLVDGRCRPECVFVGMRKLRSGGMLVLDNAERWRYRPVHEALSGWPRVFTTTGLTDTVIWFKPK